MNIKIVFLILLLVFQTSLFSQELITPEKAISLALENNYSIKLIKTDVEIAKNNASVLNSGYLPSLTASAATTFNNDNTEAQFTNGDVAVLNSAESSNYNASIDLEYIIFDGFGRAYNFKQLNEQKQLTALQARETIENTILQLFTIYYNVAELSENAHAFSKTLIISKDRLKRASYQFDYGQVSKLGVLNATVDINNDSINLMNSKQQLKNAKRDLNLVLGNTLNEIFNVDSKIEFNSLYDKEHLLQKAKTNNINLLQINKSITISVLDVKLEKKEYLPTLGLIGSYGWNKNNNNAASFVSTSTNTGLSGGLRLSWSLFDGGKTITQLRNAKISLDAQKIQKEQIEVALERDFNNAWDDYQNKLKIYQLQESNIETTKNNFDRTKEKFKLGQVNSIEFRQAQLNLLSAELNKNQAKYSAKLAELQMIQISGMFLKLFKF